MELKEEILLTYLRKDGRMPLTQMSKESGVAISTLHDRLRKTACIMKVTALLNFTRLGYFTKAHIFLKAHKLYRDQLFSYLMEHYHVNNLYKINNGYDFLLECVFKDLRDLEDFLQELDDKFKVTAPIVHYIISDLKREGFYSDTKRLGIVKPESLS